MANFTKLVRDLRKERDRVEKHLSALNAAVTAFAAVYRGEGKPGGRRRKLSAKARAKIAAAQRARWAKVRSSNSGQAHPGKRVMSIAARRKIAAAQRARWAKVKQEKKAA